jgi:hypothetical protein
MNNKLPEQYLQALPTIVKNSCIVFKKVALKAKNEA